LPAISIADFSFLMCKSRVVFVIPRIVVVLAPARTEKKKFLNIRIDKFNNPSCFKRYQLTLNTEIVTNCKTTWGHDTSPFQLIRQTNRDNTQTKVTTSPVHVTSFIIFYLLFGNFVIFFKFYPTRMCALVLCFCVVARKNRQ